MIYDVLIVGAGIVGCTIAERLATVGKKKILIIERAEEIGGLCSTRVDAKTGILYPLCGTHIYYTNSRARWDYLNKFSPFSEFKHTVFSSYQNELFPIPINLNTINKYFKKKLNPIQAKALILKKALPYKLESYTNIEQVALSELGPELYYAFVKGFTEKLWCKNASTINAEVFLKRFKIRFSSNNAFFDNYKFQGFPYKGYTELFYRMLDRPTIHLKKSCDYRQLSKKELLDFKLIVFTGAIDEFFKYKYGEIERGFIEMEKEIIANREFQGTSVVNYPEPSFEYLRIHEPKFLNINRYDNLDMTLILKEYHSKSRKNTSFGFPIDSKSNLMLFRKYHTMAQKTEKVHFIGRESIPYLNMDMSVASANKLCSTILKEI